MQPSVAKLPKLKSHVAAVASINSTMVNSLTNPENIRVSGVFIFLESCNFPSKSTSTYVFFSDFEHNSDKLIIKKWYN